MVTLLVHLLYSSTLLSKARFLLRGKQGQLDSPQVGEYPKKITIQYTNRQAYQKHIFPPNNDQIADEIALDSRLLAETHTSWFASLRYLLNTSYWTLSKQYQNSSKKPLVCQGRAAALLEDNPILLPKLFGEGSLHPEHGQLAGNKLTSHLDAITTRTGNLKSQLMIPVHFLRSRLSVLPIRKGWMIPSAHAASMVPKLSQNGHFCGSLNVGFGRKRTSTKAHCFMSPGICTSWISSTPSVRWN